MFKKTRGRAGRVVLALLIGIGSATMAGAGQEDSGDASFRLRINPEAETASGEAPAPPVQVGLTYQPPRGQETQLAVEAGPGNTRTVKDAAGNVLAEVHLPPGVPLNVTTVPWPEPSPHAVRSQLTVAGRAGIVYHAQDPDGPDRLQIELRRGGPEQVLLDVSFNAVHAHVAGEIIGGSLFLVRDDRGTLAAFRDAAAASPFARAALLDAAEQFRSRSGEIVHAAVLAQVADLALGSVFRPGAIPLIAGTVTCLSGTCDVEIECKESGAKVRVTLSAGESVQFDCPGDTVIITNFG